MPLASISEKRGFSRGHPSSAQGAIYRRKKGAVERKNLHKGQAQGGGKKSLGRRARGRRKKREPGRGHDDKDRPAIIAWVSRQGAVIIHATRDFTVNTG